MSSDSEYDENPSDQQSENEENGNEEAATENGTTNGENSETPATWNDLVCVHLR